MRIIVDRTVCQSMAYCTHEAPRTLDLDDEGLATVIDPGGDPDDAVVRAAKACPVRAIRLLDESGQQRFPAPG